MATVRRPARGPIQAMISSARGGFTYSANAAQVLTGQTIMYGSSGFSAAGSENFVHGNAANAGVAFGNSSIGIRFLAFATSGIIQSASTFPLPETQYYDAAGTWDGGLLASGMNVYGGFGGSPLKLLTPSATVNGTGTINGPGAANITIGAVANACTFYVARWNRVLSIGELLLAQQHGPLSVNGGLVFCWISDTMFGRDHGPYGLTLVEYYRSRSDAPQRFYLSRPIWGGMGRRVHSSRQFAAPISDISNNGWTPSTGSDRYATIDEPAPPDFADYDFSPTDPAGQSFRVKIAPAGDPLSSGGHLWRYALRAMGQDTVFTIKVFLGESELDSWTENVSAVDGDVIRFHQLTGAVADAITDYADVRVDISAAAP